MCAIEFGAAAGNGVVVMENLAAAVEKEMGVQIHVIGFDTGAGLPDVANNYRNHPNQWPTGLYAMEVDNIRAKLHRARLILGGRKTDRSRVCAAPTRSSRIRYFRPRFLPLNKNAMRIPTHPQRKLFRRLPLSTRVVSGVTASPANYW